MGVAPAERRQPAAERSAGGPPGLGAEPARCTYAWLCRGFLRRAGCALLGRGSRCRAGRPGACNGAGALHAFLRPPLPPPLRPPLNGSGLECLVVMPTWL